MTIFSIRIWLFFLKLVILGALKKYFADLNPLNCSYE